MASEHSPTPLQAKIPTALTAGRIALTFPVALFVVMDTIWAGGAAFALFLIAAALDWFDGRLARRWNATSELGRALDPVADKVLVAGTLLALAVDGLVFGWALLPALVIVGRDFLVSGLREFAAGAGRTLHVTGLAKWKTAAELAALGLLLATPALGPLIGARLGAASLAVYQGGIVMLWIAGALSAWTGAAYVLAVMDVKRRGPEDWE